MERNKNKTNNIRIQNHWIIVLESLSMIFVMCYCNSAHKAQWHRMVRQYEKGQENSFSFSRTAQYCWVFDGFFVTTTVAIAITIAAAANVAWPNLWMMISSSRAIYTHFGSCFVKWTRSLFVFSVSSSCDSYSCQSSSTIHNNSMCIYE